MSPNLSPTQIERFWGRVDRSGGPDACWPWTGAKTPAGYGKQRAVRSDGRVTTLGAHRAAYALTVAPIPAGLELDHLCRNRGCCNPAHLEPVTHRENVRRGQVARTGRVDAETCGTSNRYESRGCRCELCRAAMARKHADWRRSTSTPVRHGTLTGYAARGCRCGPCRDARRAYAAGRALRVAS